MFRRKQSPADTQLRRKVLPFVAVEMSLSLEKELRLRIIFAGEKTFSPSSPKAVSPPSFS
jgi:hypothetical protein